MSVAPDPVREGPRLGFVGTGWIGRHRMEAIARSGAGTVAAIADPSKEVTAALRESFPDVEYCSSLDGLLELSLDGVVIATPSALHSAQSIQALERGVAVFCQKPLGRNEAETRAVIEAARNADRLLGVDFSYRFAAAFLAAREVVRSGEIGELFGIDLVFHNAYGPDKEWFYDRASSGGGCLMDLGIHLVDIALWTAGGRPEEVGGTLFSSGERMTPGSASVEDYAVASFRLNDAAVRLACSWKLPAGRDAVIEASFYGTRGGVAVRNVDGSFYDFVAERYEGTKTIPLIAPPDEWGGRAAVAWASQLAAGGAYDASVEELIQVAHVLDAIYSGEGGGS